MTAPTLDEMIAYMREELETAQECSRNIFKIGSVSDLAIERHITLMNAIVAVLESLRKKETSGGL